MQKEDTADTDEAWYNRHDGTLFEVAIKILCDIQKGDQLI